MDRAMKRTTEATNAEVRELLRSRGTSVEDAANLLNLDLAMIYRWLGDENPPMPAYMQALLRDRLGTVRPSEARLQQR